VFAFGIENNFAELAVNAAVREFRTSWRRVLYDSLEFWSGVDHKHVDSTDINNTYTCTRANSCYIID